MLTAGGPPRPGTVTRPGTLAGGRHIGHLMRILEAAHVTPDRYSVASFSDALGRLTRSGAASALAPDQLRDRLAYFAWLLHRLNAAEPGETVLERVRREAAERAAEQARHRAAALADAAAREGDRERAEAAAAAFFAEVRRQRGRRSQDGHSMGVRQLVQAVTGRSRRLYDAPTAVQVLVGRLTQLHRTLTAAGWTLSCSSEGLEWHREEDCVVIPLRRQGYAVDVDRACVRGSIPEGFADLQTTDAPTVGG